MASSEISAATTSRGSDTPLCICVQTRDMTFFIISSWKHKTGHLRRHIINELPEDDYVHSTWNHESEYVFFLQLDGLPRSNISYLKWKNSINKNYLSKYTAKPWDLDAKFVFSHIIRNQIILLNEKKDTNACQHFILPTSFSINKKIWQDFCW